MMFLDIVVGAAFVAVALVAASAAPAMRLWWAAAGLAWWLGDLEPLRLVHQGVLAAALAAYPVGRLRGWRPAVVVAIGGVMALGAVGQAGAAAGFLATAGLVGRAGLYARVAAVVVGLWLAASYAWSAAWPAAFDPPGALLGYEVVLLAVALSMPLGLWADSRRRSALTDRVLTGDEAGLRGLEAALRRALGTRELRLTRDGDDVRVAGLDGVDGETVAAVDRAVSLTLAHERALTAAARQVGDLESARLRLLTAADAERARAVVALNDDLVVLRECQASLSGLPDLAREVDAAVADVDRIVAGLPPPGLGGGGIGPALAALCDRFPADVRRELDPRAQGSLDAETALFFACSEALTNVAKHARARSVSVRLQAGDPLVLVVADDGVGGADPRGTGLENLLDRLSTLGGHLTIDSRPGHGTHVVVEVPAR